MSVVDLHTIWARVKGEPEAPWLIDAWDEFTIDDNPSGWAEAIAKAESTTDEMRVVVVRVDYDEILAAFTSSAIKGEVQA